jgi:hypothetical protein
VKDGTGSVTVVLPATDQGLHFWLSETATSSRDDPLVLGNRIINVFGVGITTPAEAALSLVTSEE